MAKTISDQTREYFCYIKQKVRKGEKVMQVWEVDSAVNEDVRGM